MGFPHLALTTGGGQMPAEGVRDLHPFVYPRAAPRKQKRLALADFLCLTAS
jgi:hypothetical protein